MARACGVQRNLWKGSHIAYVEKILWTGEVARLATLLARPGNSSKIAPNYTLAARGCASCANLNVHVASSAAWEKRQQKRSHRPSGFRSKESGNVSWLGNCNKLARVHAQLTTSGHADQLLGPGLETRFTPESVKKLCQQRQVKGALEALEGLVGMDYPIDKYVLYSVLKECLVNKDLALGGQVHALAKKLGLGSDTFLCNHFIRMYAAHGQLQKAMDVFREVALPDAFMWSSITSAHVKQGHAQRAIQLYQQMRGSKRKPDGHVLVAVLQACAASGDLQSGKQVHNDVLIGGMDHDMFVCNCLVDMYTKCGSLQDARRVFDTLSTKNVVTWSAMIAGYARVEGMGSEALALYSAMRDEGIAAPNAVTFVSLLQACANMGLSALGKGKQLHSELKDQRLESDVVVGGSLVNMYVKCGSLKDARVVFDGLMQKNVVTWNAMITGYAQREGMGHEALSLYSAMHNEGMVVPDAVTYVPLLQACAYVGSSALDKGKQLHSELKNRRLESDEVVGASLVNMYVKCGSLKDARRVFDGLGDKKVVIWTAMIAGYAQEKGMGQEALDLYSAMQYEGTASPDAVTFVCLLQACANVGVPAIHKGKEIHAQLKDQGLESDVIVGGSLVNMYAKCGNLEDARVIFDGLHEKNVVTWNAMISGYAQQQVMSHEALNLYIVMNNHGMTAPDATTFTCLLQACANVGVPAIDKGKQLHSQLKDQNLECHLGGSLVNMYAKCGSLNDARRVFDGLSNKDVVTWTAMIAGYSQHEEMGQEALGLYSAMHDDGMVAPNAVTFTCLLQACANVGVPALDKGKKMHSQLKDQGLESDVVVGASLVSMYVKCGSLVDARIVFDGLSYKDVVTWTSMIAGYAQQEGMSQEALDLYCAMRNEGKASPNVVTYQCLLEACAHAGALQQGKQLHSEICDRGLASNVLIGSSLVNMYAKCGRLELSREVFDKLPEKEVAVWNALLKGYAEHGEGGMAIQCFEELVEQGIQPDEVTYNCLLTACSHAGLVDQGQQYFDTMTARHGVQPNAQLHCCMVDLLGRSGHLDRAERLLLASGFADDAVSWRALLSACKSYGAAETARRCFDHLVKLEPTMATAYVLLGRIYASAGRWDEVERVESLRTSAGAIKKAAKACIEVNKEVHEFTVGEERSDVAATLRKMNTKVQEGGHVPQTQLVLRAVSEQEKEDALCGHAEKLALAYGLLNTPAGSTLVVTKNLRMCNDCHSSTKILSQFEKREIVVRDGHKVHRFLNGACSCQNRP